MERLVNDGMLPNLDFSNLSTYVECVKGKLTFKVGKNKMARCKGIFKTNSL